MGVDLQNLFILFDCCISLYWNNDKIRWFWLLNILEFTILIYIYIYIYILIQNIVLFVKKKII